MLAFRTPSLVLLAIASIALIPIAVFAQTGADSQPAPPLQINVRNVLVDVVVTAENGAAVPGLHKNDFQLLENGKPQKIEFFEPHFPGSTIVAPKAPTLPPNTFTNVPATEPNQAINILLMDALNTTMAEQIVVRQQMVKYLRTVPPGLRIGVFMLGDRLRIIQGFTDDSALLRASITSLAGKPTETALESTPNELAAQSNAIGDLTTMADGPGGAQLAEMISSLQAFLAQSTNIQKNLQLLTTLDALETIAHYVSAVPGRKNLIWFVGSFPLCQPGVTSSFTGCPYEDRIQKTMNVLAAARVSLYPVDAGGVWAPNSDIGGAGRDQAGSLLPGTSIPGGHATSASTDLHFQFIASESWAQITGGKAMHNNDLTGALAKDIENGSSYYTVAYTPTDKRELGRVRNIEIRIPSAKHKLSYRRAYFEPTSAETKTASAQPESDPLRPMMDRGMPNFADLHFRMHVDRSATLASEASQGGDNPALAQPLKRYTVQFFLSPKDLNLVQGPDGVRRAPIEVALIAYNQRGDSLNWLVRSVDLSIRPDQMAVAQSSGIPFHFDFDLPPGDVYLRAGVYDPSTNRAGTLEIPVAALQPDPANAAGGH